MTNNTDITGDVHKWLRQATDEQLKNYLALISSEQTRRYRLFIRLESDLMGGHRVWVSEGGDFDTFAAYCMPDPDAECWSGDDRRTVGEALEDGRKHHPGYEPMLLL